MEVTKYKNPFVTGITLFAETVILDEAMTIWTSQYQSNITLDFSSSLPGWDNNEFRAEYRKEKDLQWTSEGLFESDGNLFVKCLNNLEPGLNYRMRVLRYSGECWEGISSERIVQTEALSLGKSFLWGMSKTVFFILLFKSVSSTHGTGESKRNLNLR